MPTIDPEMLWIVLGLVLAIAEIALPGIFLIWLGIAALLTGLATLATGMALAAQLGTFAVAALATVQAGRSVIKRNPPKSADPLLNDRLARLVGEQVVVVEAIEDGLGRVRVGDGVWTACGPDTPAGTRMHVIGHDQGRLVVARSG
ncbi:NfeD family protein [Sphingomonas prati]|uniref:NfeD-like C-terminal domain-containing protein n=1 Tax=Sphingomonas prati TaxID=1843237 RepID=A0A7W9F0N9_9SPHN|nr:NfeD family protein [Sphingomonas prati]MBB5728582.1 hypothetical protein [Sphingomonas prati]GGE72657.1 membrane protein [Sphingomonas prati]